MSCATHVASIYVASHANLPGLSPIIFCLQLLQFILEDNTMPEMTNLENVFLTLKSHNIHDFLWSIRVFFFFFFFF